jgi:16S rRNA (uracil1498-N3)-methyltransferase
MALHRIMVAEGRLECGAACLIEGDEAQHAARVKRLTEGDPLELLDGRGRVATATLERIERRAPNKQWSITARVHSVRLLPPVSPRIEIWSAVPKGPRLEEMIEGLSQTGCALWRPLHCERTIVEPREGKLSRLERVTRESAKQCGRPWIMEIGEPISFREALQHPTTPDSPVTLLADATGSPAAAQGQIAASATRLLIGPEGGFSDRELADADEARIPRIRLGPHILRIELAAILGAALLINRLALASN